jgi:hypothetical protein
MIATFMNTAFVLSIGVFFSLMVAGLSSKLPGALTSGLTAQGIPAAAAHTISHLPPIGVLFAAFLGYNPMAQLLGPHLLANLPAGHALYVTGRQFFPHLITGPFHDGLGVAFAFAIAASLIAAVASLLTGRRPGGAPAESLGAELAAVAADGGLEPSELVVPDPAAGASDATRVNGQSTAITESGGKAITESGGKAITESGGKKSG